MSPINDVKQKILDNAIDHLKEKVPADELPWRVAEYLAKEIARMKLENTTVQVMP